MRICIVRRGFKRFYVLEGVGVAAVTLGAGVSLVGEVLALEPREDDAEAIGAPTSGSDVAGEGTVDTSAAFGAVTALDSAAISSRGSGSCTISSEPSGEVRTSLALRMGSSKV